MRYVPAGAPAWGHQEPDADDFAIVCDEDGDDCRRNQGNQGGYNYAPPTSYYSAPAPAAYNLIQRRDLLIARRQQAYITLAQARTRGDRHAVNVMRGVIKNLNARIGTLNGKVARGSSAYVPPVNYAVPNTAYGTAYNPYYGNTNPGMSPIVSLIGPLLGMPY